MGDIRDEIREMRREIREDAHQHREALKDHEEKDDQRIGELKSTLDDWSGSLKTWRLIGFLLITLAASDLGLRIWEELAK